MDFTMFGSQILTKHGLVSVDTLKDLDYIGLYFSAHWCPPCRGFTPELATFYNKLKPTDKGKKMEIIFVTCDRDEQQFIDYYKEMPWMAVPFSESALRILTKHGLVSVDTLKDLDYIGLYFSAHWCPPCRGFTPELATFYNKLKPTDKGKKMEIIFVTCDRDEQQFIDYYKEMPWMAVPFSESALREELSGKFDVGGIPHFVIVDCKTGEVTTDEGREKVSADPHGFPWK